MSAPHTKASQLLETALQQAADVARTRLGRDIEVVAAEPIDATAILRFDLGFSSGGRLSWYVSNEDATGFADMLIGGAGDRAAVLTEMHLDALTVAFSDMLQRTVEAIAAGLDQSVEAGEVDLGMEGELPAIGPDATRVVRALEITGFGALPIVQQADAELSQFLELHATAQLATAQAAPTPDAAAGLARELEEPPASAGPSPAVHVPAPASADNVVALPQATAAAHAAVPPRASQGDLDMLMNVPLPLTVELGHTQRTIRELVDFSIGSIIELGKLAGDPLDIKVNDRVIARGEVVVIDEEFGIRVTEIVSPEERLHGLG